MYMSFEELSDNSHLMLKLVKLLLQIHKLQRLNYYEYTNSNDLFIIRIQIATIVLTMHGI